MVLAEIRAACAEVASRARQVRIVGDPAAYAAALDLSVLTAPVYDTTHHYRGDPESTLAYLVTLDAINFGSGYFPHLVKRPGMSGYFTIASRLKDHFAAHGAIDAEELTRLTAAQVAAILAQPPGDPVEHAYRMRSELMALFARALNDLGRFLLERYGGRFAGLIEDAGGSTERLVECLAAMPYFRDVSWYQGIKVPLFKRAQITALDLSLAFSGEGYGAFDLEQLTIFADNLVPHVLRTDGLLDYHRDLAERIARGELIPPGSSEEIEIRAVALHAVEAMVAALRARGVRVSACQLDVLLWNRGQRTRYKKLPRHRTRTVYY